MTPLCKKEYGKLQKDISQLLKDITLKLQVQAIEFSKDGNWTYVGSLTYVKSELEKIKYFIS